MPKNEEEKTRLELAQERLNSVNAQKPGAWNAEENAKPMQMALDQLKNRQPFQFNINGDALYNQYKNAYMNQGKQAMMNTMGQATALTGGYGNSYAQTAGQQTFQGYMNSLNDKIPELYQAALDRYNSEGNNLQNQYALAKDQYDQKYGEYMDSMNLWQNDLNNAMADYNSEVSNNYSGYINPDDVEVDENGNILSIKGYNLGASNSNALKDRKWTVENDGGTNHFGGANRNARVKDADGNVFSISKLQKNLIEEGMSKEEAKEYIRRLQISLGIN